MSNPIDRMKKLIVRGGPLLRGNHEVKEFSLGGVGLLDNMTGFKLTGGINDIIRLNVEYILIDTDIEMLTGVVEHKLMLQRVVRKMGPDMEMSSYKAWIVEQIGESLPDAMRRMADRIEAEGIPAENPIPTTEKDLYAPRDSPLSAFRTVEDQLEKRCTRCGDWWPADAEFYARDRSQKGGLQSWCKACWYEYKVARSTALRPGIRRRRAAADRSFE